MVNVTMHDWWRAMSVPLLVIALAGWPLAHAAPLEPVTLQLKWKHQFQFAGYYAALAQGYYREAGLEVNIVEARPDHDPVAAVLSGEADFGVGAANLLLLRARGEPVVALAVIFQHSPQMLLARRGPDLNHVHDLNGKRVHIEPGSAELLAYLRREGIASERLGVMPYNLDVAALIDGQVDAISAYVTDQPFAARQAGLDYLIFSPRAAGIDFYGDNLFTTEAQIEAYPRRVEAFLAASLRGWRYAMEHPEEIIELILAQYSQRHSREHLRYEAEQMQYLILPVLVELGQMNPGRWRHMAETYAELGMLPGILSLKGFLYEANPKVDLRWFYWSLAAALVLVLVGGVVILHIHRLNRDLRREVRERKTAETKFRGLVEQSLVGIYILQEGRFVYVNPKFAEIFGYAVEDIVGRLGLLDLTAQADREQVRENLCRIDSETGGIRYAFSAIRQDGSLIDVEVNEETAEHEGHPAIVGVVLDITEQRRAQQQLNYLAFYDPLTELPNRALFFDRFCQLLAQSQRNGTPFALLMLDLDGFKAVNDAHGHKTGDALLVAVGQRLRNCVRESDTVARMGGDEFVLLLQNVQEAESAPPVAGKILAALAEPFPLLGHECWVGASIGLCIAPRDGDDMETLLGHADAAMYQSKARGKNTYTCYQPTLNTLRPAKTALLEWSEALCVGVPVIDEQHAQLVALLNQVDNDLKTGQDKERIMARLRDLGVFTRYHFDAEEQLMDQYAYADAVTHQQEHCRLLEDLLSIQSQFDSASLTLSLQALKHWLGHHITHGDRRLAKALIASGVLKSQHEQ